MTTYSRKHNPTRIRQSGKAEVSKTELESSLNPACKAGQDETGPRCRSGREQGGTWARVRGKRGRARERGKPVEERCRLEACCSPSCGLSSPAKFEEVPVRKIGSGRL